MPGTISHQNSNNSHQRSLMSSTTTQHMTLKKVMHIFCSNSSMRGVPKLVKNRAHFLRFLWISFVLSQSIFLAVGVTNLVHQYLKYNTVIDASADGSDEAPDFPSVTVCNHHPFGNNSEQLWASGMVKSPKEFSTSIRTMIAKLVDRGQYKEAKQLFDNDKLAAYYETIGLNQAKQIGHEKDIIANCVLQLKNSVRMGHSNECGINITLFRHPSHFNCYTIKILTPYIQDTVALGLIIHVGKDPDSKYLEYSLLQNVIHQARGSLVTVHEPDTYPDPIGHSTSLEPGKMTSMVFEASKFTAVNSPKESCLSEESEIPSKNFDNFFDPPLPLIKKRNYWVQSVPYKYNREICQQEIYGKLIQEKCKCYSNLYPMDDEEREREKLPFCHYMNFNDFNATYKRLKCYHDVYQRKITMGVGQGAHSDGGAGGKSSECNDRCTRYFYDVHTSTTQWSAANWQLYWLMKLSDAWEDLVGNDTDRQLNETDRKKKQDKALAIIRDFTSKDGEKAINKTLNVMEHVFLLVSRNQFVTTKKVETLSISMSKLMSSLGGLSSITIGITVATLFDLVEFVYLICTGTRLSQKAKQLTAQEVEGEPLQNSS